MGKQLGVDLGTTNTRICCKDRGPVLRAPTAIAVNKQTREVIAVGSEAKHMLGKTPDGIDAYTPIQGGVIADFDIAVALLRYFFHRIQAVSFLSRPTAAVCIPRGATEVERRALEDAAFEAGAKLVAIVEKPLAAAIGSGLRVSDARGSMIVDIGGGTTEIAVVSLGGIVASSTVRNAGDLFDAAIIRHIKNEKGILIGKMTAEQLKIQIGSVHPKIHIGEAEISGRDVHTGLATTAVVNTADIRSAISDEIDALVTAIRQTLEETPAELSSDICDYGLMLCGGGARLPGIDRILAERLGIRVTIAKHPMESVALGLQRFVDNNGVYRGIPLQYRTR